MIKVIIGRNGSGKTTYLRRYENKKGTLLVDAKAPTPGVSIFSKLKLKDLVETSKDDKYIENFNHIVDYFSMKYLWDRDIGVMSGGELKIINIALLLSCSPKKLLLDEPERDLSEGNTKLLVKLINSISNKVEFWIATHDKTIFEGLKDKNVFEIKDYKIKKIKKEKWD